MSSGSWLQTLVKAMFPSQDVRVDLLPDRDAYRVSLLFTARDLARYVGDPVAGAKHLRALVPVKRPRRRLHWGKKR